MRKYKLPSGKVVELSDTDARALGNMVPEPPVFRVMNYYEKGYSMLFHVTAGGPEGLAFVTDNEQRTERCEMWISNEQALKFKEWVNEHVVEIDEPTVIEDTFCIGCDPDAFCSNRDEGLCD